jgi:hypothetical protein
MRSFFWLFLPETARRPLEEMNCLFTHAPWIVVGTSKESYISHDLENRLDAIAHEKGVGVVGHEESVGSREMAGGQKM